MRYRKFPSKLSFESASTGRIYDSLDTRLPIHKTSPSADPKYELASPHPDFCLLKIEEISTINECLFPRITD